jgi:hypothetical protein
MSHDDPAHLSTVHRLQTGHVAPRPKSDADGPSPGDWPHLGAVIARLTPPRGALPPAVILPWIVSHPAAPGGKAPGQHGGWLGKAYDPFLVAGDPNAEGFRVPGLGLPDGVGPERIGTRKALLARLPGGLGAGSLASWDRNQERAMDALVSADARGAFQLEREDPRVRDRYGRHIHGQGLLLARRLVEAGVPLVTVFWPNDGITNVSVYWDTHNRNFVDLRERLMPPADRAFSALLDDLEARGLLDETLVVWTGEFGRTPRVGQSVVGGAGAGADGRDHWPHCFSTVLAGAGIRGGVVHGASDRWAAHPARDPVTPADVAATIYHALGIDPALELRDPLDRPLRLCLGEPIGGVLA